MSRRRWIIAIDIAVAAVALALVCWQWFVFSWYLVGLPNAFKQISKYSRKFNST